LVVAEAQYHNPAAAEFMVATLLGRRDKIVHYWFERVPPLDYFRAGDGGVAFMDLAVERGFTTSTDSRYRYRLAAVDEQRQGSGPLPWQETDTTRVPLIDADGDFLTNVPIGDAGHRFLAVEVQLDRGQGWSAGTTAYFSLDDGHSVAVDR